MLRFGRVIGSDPLSPADTPFGVKVKVSDDEPVWVNLHPADGKIKVSSDADFPDFMRWTLIDGSNSVDSRCKDSILHSWLGQLCDPTDTDGSKTSFANKHDRLDADIVQRRLSRVICKFPTEWNPDTIDTLWGWLKTKNEERGDALSDDDYTKFQNHVKALAFWKSDIGIPEKPWHFHPQEFIKIFRRSGWLSMDEITRLFPQYPIYTKTGNLRTAVTTGSTSVTGKISLSTAKERIKNYQIPFNQAMRKYGLSSARKRQVHFFAQVFLETDRWITMKEYGQGTPVAAIPMIQYYAAFYGHGCLQLTWAENYERYGIFKNIPNNESGHYEDHRITQTSTHYWGDPTLRGNNNQIIGLDPHKPARVWFPRFDPKIVAEDPFYACDSAGFFWVSASLFQRQGMNINRMCDRSFNTDTAGDVSTVVNGGSYAYFERQAYAVYAYRVLLDDTDTAQKKNWQTNRPEHPHGNVMVTVEVDFTNPN